jgi:hypothetical protein
MTHSNLRPVENIGDVLSVIGGRVKAFAQPTVCSSTHHDVVVPTSGFGSCAFGGAEVNPSS